MNYDVIALFQDPISHITQEVSRNTYRDVTLEQAKACADETMEELGCQKDMPTHGNNTWHINHRYPTPVYSRDYYIEYHPDTGDMLDTPSELWVYIGESPLTL